MKKIFFSLFLICSFAMLASAQGYEGTITYDKKKQRAIMMDYNYSADAVQNAIVLKMAKLGYKPKEEKGIFNKDKGFLVFKNAAVTDISSDQMDYIVKVERKSRKESDASTMYVIMTKGDQNAMDKLDPFDISRAKSFVGNMVPDVEAADLELQIIAQQDVVAKAEKKLKGLKDDQVSLEKKLADNKSDQEGTSKDIENQKIALERLFGKRRAN